MSVPFHDFTPLIAGLTLEHGFNLIFETRPFTPVKLHRKVRIILQAGVFQQQGVKLGLDRAHTNVFAVFCLIGVVIVRTAIQQVALPVICPQSGSLQCVETWS